MKKDGESVITRFISSVLAIPEPVELTKECCQIYERMRKGDVSSFVFLVENFDMMRRYALSVPGSNEMSGFARDVSDLASALKRKRSVRKFFW